MKTRALLLAASLLLARRAEAEPEANPTLLRLSATSDELHARRTAELARQLERLLARLPEVDRAHAELTLPNVDRAPLDRPLPRPRALVVVEGRAPVPEREVQASARSLLGDDVVLTLLQRPRRAEPSPPLVRVGPFEVSATSAHALEGTLVGLLTSNLLLASLLVWRTRRDRPREPKVDRHGRSSQAP